MRKIEANLMAHIEGGRKASPHWAECTVNTVAAIVTTATTVLGGLIVWGFTSRCWAGYIDG